MGDRAGKEPALRCLFQLREPRQVTAESHRRGRSVDKLETLDRGKPLSVARVVDVPLAADLLRGKGGWATRLEAKIAHDLDPGNWPVGIPQGASHPQPLRPDERAVAVVQ